MVGDAGVEDEDKEESACEVEAGACEEEGVEYREDAYCVSTGRVFADCEFI